MPKRELTFLSYANEDRHLVEKLYASLKKRNIKVWLDKMDMKGGRWLDQITSAILRSNTFIFCMSTAAMKKLDKGIGVQGNELRDAYEIAKNQPEKDFNIFPVRLDNCDRGDHRLSQFNQFDLFEDWETVVDKIAIQLGGKSLINPLQKDTRTDKQISFEQFVRKIEAHVFAYEYSEVSTIIESALVDYKLGSERWSYIGHMLSTKNGSNIAIKVFEHATTINPDYAEAYCGKGNAYYWLENYPKAMKQYNIAIKIDQNFAEAFVGRGNVLRKDSKYQDAIKQFDIAINIEPKLASAFHNKGLALSESGSYEEAIKEFDIALGINSNLALTYNSKGWAFHRLCNYEKAIQQYDKAIEIDSNYAKAYENKRRALEKLNRLHEAKETDDKAKELDSPFQTRTYIIHRTQLETTTFGDIQHNKRKQTKIKKGKTK